MSAVKNKDVGTSRKYVNMKKSSIALFAVLVLILSTVIGGTMAWIITRTSPVVNTFTYGDINITLEETDTKKDDDEDPNTNQYEMMPGEEITKDPKITVKKGSKDNWLFVKLEKSDNFDDFMTYSIADGWSQLLDGDGNEIEGVFYQEVEETEVADADREFTVIKDNLVTVKDDVTKEQLNALDETDPPSYPVLNVTAYAVQRNSEIEAIDSALDAWNLANQEASETP